MSSIYRGASGLVRVISQNRKSVSPRVMSRFVALGRPNLTSMFCIFFLEFQSSASAEDSRWRCLSWCCTVTSCNEPSTTGLPWKLVSPMGIILPENSPPVSCSVRLARLILLSRHGVVVTPYFHFGDPLKLFTKIIVCPTLSQAQVEQMRLLTSRMPNQHLLG